MKEALGVLLLVGLILLKGGVFDEVIKDFMGDHPIITAIIFLVAIIGPWKIIVCGCLTFLVLVWFIL